MAKKKKKKSAAKKTVAKKQASVAKSQSNFWPFAGGVVLLVLALFLLFGGFGGGGALPKDLFSIAYAIFGWAAWVLIPTFIYWAVYKFADDEHKMPFGRLVSLLAALVFASCWLFTVFASRISPQAVWQHGHGGALGRGIGGAVLGALDKFPASIMFFIFALFAAFFAAGISPKVLLKIGKLFERGAKDDDTDLAALKQGAEPPDFKLNEGVPVEHVSELEKPQHTNIKNTAQKLSSAESHDALTLASDTDWQFPGIDLLSQQQDKAGAGNVNENVQTIRETLGNFNINVEMESANVGPRVTQYTLKPPAGTKLTKITALESNLALDLGAESIRIEAPIPGKKAVGIEVPNVKPAMVRVGSLLASEDWQKLNNPLGFAIGKDISGQPIVGALDKMPHLLIAGQTGSGKSIMINTLITSLLYRNSPSDMKLILVDPKRVELTPYQDIPHLLTPVIIEPEKCISALKWAVAEMERRYRELSAAGKRNIGDYNNFKQQEGMPYIVIIIDELADLMMMAARDVEALIVRIAAKARAVGIHLVLATQSPRVDVITGLIKNNIPARIAFSVPGQVDSRVMIDHIGAEKLLGQGDMLLMTAERPKPIRVQGAFISDTETHKVTDFIRMQRPPQYDDEIISQPVQIGRGSVVAQDVDTSDEPVYKDAVAVALQSGKVSTSLLQRRLGLGYGRAAKIVDKMEEQGIIGPSSGNKAREVLISSLDDVFGGSEATDSQDFSSDEDSATA
ncbi:MAG: DNA translocase FtsK 4TM domain-containing protein [Candidatus Saccharimonadales bacterium]